uniref:Uncharacterized protein n=1 Tax=Anopheles minimus TaxID=112268 RepID=A0A182WAJ0_9DIPT
MFSKFKSATTSAPPQNPYDNNPITQYFEVGKLVACAGPELIWKIHEGYRKTDGKCESQNVKLPYIFHVHVLALRLMKQ